MSLRARAHFSGFSRFRFTAARLTRQVCVSRNPGLRFEDWEFLNVDEE